MTPVEVAWVTGILEGEGCFDSQQKKPNHRVQPRVRLSMTDEDVVVRFATLVGATVHRVVRGAQRKDAFNIEIKGEAAVALMRQVRPYLGARRSAKVDEVLTAYQTTGSRAHRNDHTEALDIMRIRASS